MLPDYVKDNYALVMGAKKNKYFEVVKCLAKRLDVKEKVLFPGFISDKDFPALYLEASFFFLFAL